MTALSGDAVYPEDFNDLPFDYDENAQRTELRFREDACYAVLNTEALMDLLFGLKGLAFEYKINEDIDLWATIVNPDVGEDRGLKLLTVHSIEESDKSHPFYQTHGMFRTEQARPHDSPHHRRVFYETTREELRQVLLPLYDLLRQKSDSVTLFANHLIVQMAK
jgi:hypothetical protein